MAARAVRAVLLAVVLPASAGAQSVSLTESQALSLLAPDSPRVVAARSGIDVTRAEVLAAGRWPNPQVTFNREAVAGIAEDYLTVSQVLPLTGRRRLAVNAASARVEASASRAEDRVRRLRADLRLTFTELWWSQVHERELTENRDRLRALAEVLARREAAGEAAGFDRLRVDREAADADADRAAAALARLRAQAALTGFFAMPGNAAAVEAVGAEPGRAPLPPVEDLVTRAAATRGDLIALQHDLDAADFAERGAARSRIPEPELIAGTKSSNAGTGDVGSIFSVRVAVPLFDRAAPERAAAQARARQARLEAEAFRLALRAQIAALRAEVIERREMANRYRASAAGADQVQRIAQLSYDAGERGILELLDAHRTTSATRVRQAELDAAVRGAEIELEFVSGWEMP
jgi:cobalt-zinc-cadmium efflux system outer membrane protein